MGEAVSLLRGGACAWLAPVGLPHATGASSAPGRPEALRGLETRVSGANRSAGTDLRDVASPRLREHPSRASSACNTSRNGKQPSAYRPGVAIHHGKWHISPAQAEPARSPLFCVDLLHDVDFELSINQQLAQPGILPFQRFEPFDFVRFHAAELLAPRINRRFAHAMALSHFGDCVLVGLAQDPNDLLIAVSRLLHLPLAIEEAIISSYLGSKKPGQVNYLRHGFVDSHGAAGGPMAPVVREGTSRIPESDTRAMAVYLASLAANQDAG